MTGDLRFKINSVPIIHKAEVENI